MARDGLRDHLIGPEGFIASSLRRFMLLGMDHRPDHCHRLRLLAIPKLTGRTASPSETMQTIAHQLARETTTAGKRILKLAGMVAAYAALVTGSAYSAELPLTVQQLTTNTYAVVATSGPGRISANAGFVIGDDGVLVIDSLDSESSANALIGEIRKRTQLPIRFLVNTHYHLDHVGGNGVFRRAGATIVAQRGVRPRLGENMKFFGPNPDPTVRAAISALPAPDLLFDQQLTVFLGQLQVELLHLPGHTGSDTVAIVPQAQVAFAGDLVWQETIPNLIDANVPCWITTLKRLKGESGLKIQTIVPGHGLIASSGDLDALQNYLQSLTQVVAELRSTGIRGDALADAVTARLAKEFGRWRHADFFARANVRRIDADLDAGKASPGTCTEAHRQEMPSTGHAGLPVAQAPTLEGSIAVQSVKTEGSTLPAKGCSNADVDMNRLNGIATWLNSNTNYFDSVLVMHCDSILFESYRNGFTADTMHELQSATKTFSSTLVGIMLKKGLVTSLDQKIAELLPSRYGALFTGQKANITVRHLLTMTSGLSWRDFGPNNSFDQINAAADSVRFVLSQQLDSTPGQTFFYNTGSSHLLSAIVHYKSGKTTKQFAETELFEPLGIKSYTWPTLRDGVAQGGWGMYMKPRDLLKLAKLYRDGGRYGDVEILDKSFAAAAVTRQVATKYPNESYGFQMWIEEDFGVAQPNVVAGARGWGGQDALVARSKNLAVVFNGSIEQPEAMGKHTKHLFKEFIIPSHTGPDHSAN